MMRRSAGFHADEAGRQLLKEWQNVPAFELTTNDYITPSYEHRRESVLRCEIDDAFVAAPPAAKPISGFALMAKAIWLAGLFNRRYGA